MARSREFSVCVRLPWVNSFSVAAVRTPVPMTRPLGSCVFSEDWAPGWRTVW